MPASRPMPAARRSIRSSRACRTTCRCRRARATEPGAFTPAAGGVRIPLSIRSGGCRPMTPRLRTQAMGLLALTLPLVACAQAPRLPRRPSLRQLQQRGHRRSRWSAACPTSPIWSNRSARAWSTSTPPSSATTAVARGPMGDDDMPEFFRRFFGPDFPMPGQGPVGRMAAPASRAVAWARASSSRPMAMY